MKRKAYLAVLLAGALFAGCAGSDSSSSSTEAGTDSSTSQSETTDDSSDTSSETATDQKEDTAADASTAPAALNSLVEAAGDDTAALDAWKTIFTNFADAAAWQFQVDTDGEDYLYDENQAGTMVEGNFIYNIGKDSVFWKTGDDSAVAVDLTDIDDSYNTLEMGYGTIDKVGDPTVMTAVTTTSTDDDKLEGTVESVSTDAATLQDEAVNMLIDSAVDFGYVRNVNPISNASLYNYDLKHDGSKWVLKLSIKDLEGFKTQAATAAFLVNDRTNRPTLVIDNIESETFTFTFDKDGILEKEENDIYHVINGITDEYSQKYMNLLNKAEFKKAESDDLKPEAFEEYFNSCADGTLKEGDAFTISDWN